MLKEISQSLAKSTLISMGIRISIIVIITALLSYQHIIGNLEQQTLDKLSKYITERTQKESEIFKLAEDNHRVFNQAFLALWSERKNSNPEQRFQQLFDQKADGTTRLIQSAFTGIDRPHTSTNDYLGQSNGISGFVGKAAPIESAEFRNRLLLSYDLVDKFAEGWSNRFANTYVSLPEGVNIVYWPALNWAEGADSNLDIPNEEWVYIANKENDPTRKSAWTGLYYDQTADEWMVSCITPLDDTDGRHLINAGHDILLNKLFQRVFDDHLEGAYNFIVRPDGRLVAHPHHTKELEANKGLLSVNALPDEDVFSQYKSIMASMPSHGSDPMIIEDQTSDTFIAFEHIDGPDWLFVTVYPKALLSSPAQETAIFILFLGLISLVVELFMLYRVLAEKVLTPMNTFKNASDMIGEGEYELHDVLATTEQRKDEVGQLSKALLTMSNHIRSHKLTLEEQINERTQQLEDAMKFAELQARTDSLTNLPNRRAFFEVGGYALKTAKRDDLPLSLIMLDVDKFKHINDTYGHAVGDIVLKQLSTTLTQSIRPSDICARLGGEEFAVLLSNTDIDGAITVAEKIRHTIEALTVQVEDNDIRFTVSCGVSSFSVQHYLLESLLHDADIALYEAKGSGRNRVISKDNVL